ncbi:MAG: polyprenyl synthetase family protein [Planctomycetes bacterium]|nr:polyprenyl synthetase family protein [Planctomycetota bacterium]MCC7169426.1 polyprenyl synthetase family protein [Planctomycetota bacterium]
MTAPALDEWMKDRRSRVEVALERWLPREDAPPARLSAAMRYAVLGPGKKLRPLCCLMAAEAVGGQADAALPAAVALEYVHTYSLVHDDLPAMDDDDLRRGRPTVHKAFDEALAILAGDALLTLAFEVVAAHSEPSIVAAQVKALAIAAGASGMVGGQVQDIEAEGKALALDAVLAIDTGKTAAMFAAAFQLGALASGADAASERALSALGLDLGIAFQIVDDLLDQSATAEQMGKRTGKDRERGKATIPDLIGPQAAFDRARALTDRAIERSASLRSPRLIEALARSMLQRSR